MLPLYRSLLPALAIAEPFHPVLIFFFITILIIPDVPSGLYLADGLVITSMRSMELAGNCCKTSALVLPIKGEGLPLIRIITLAEPRNVTPPSISTSTDGIFFRISLAEPLCAMISWVTLYTLRSMDVFRRDFREATTTSLIFFNNTPISMVPTFSFF